MEQRLSTFLDRAERMLDVLEGALSGSIAIPDWDAAIAFRFRKLRSGRGVIAPVTNVRSIAFEDLQSIEDQKLSLIQNTERFLDGFSANNVLLSGSRGTGKSSLVRACLSAYATRGLRVLEIDSSDLAELPQLLDILGARPERFLIYCDDLSFEDGDPGYKCLKSALDGSILGIGANTLLYVTSNRRHLMPEYISESPDGRSSSRSELHPEEGVEEKISLSERFGLWLSFYPFSQDEYLRIVNHWLTVYGLSEASVGEARAQALVWALGHGSRSGRVASQFARDYAAAFHREKPQ